MAEIVQIQVKINDTTALSTLQSIKSLCDQLNKTPVEIKINNGGNLDTITRRVASLNKETLKSINLDKQKEIQSSKTRQAELNKETQLLRSADKSRKATSATQKATLAQQKYNQEAQQGSKRTKILGDSLGNIAIKMATWQLMGTAVSTAIGSIKDGLETIKEVDSELATIRKVTGMNESETQALGESAFATASQYGVEASEYLASVAQFARAGYQEAAQGLGELATKTQLVGDTNAQTASQFLLSADAAWKYKGNVEELSLILDKANEIDNNYATSIEKIAEGIPIVGNVAAMAGMSAEETMAALGTITATTQETGRKAATALRALVLNILGDTSTEIEEGVTATEDSVESLGQILAKYAPEAVAAAEATGELINPMEAIEALSKAAKDGLMTEADMMQLVSALGGKLRTNQLTALLENFDMYEAMLQDMATAAGSADKEIDIMLDTWEGRANQVKNSWTKLVSSVANTKVIKVGLVGLKKVLDALNSDFGQTAIRAGLVGASVSLLAGGAIKANRGIKALAMSMGPIPANMSLAAAATKGLIGSLTALTPALLSNPFFWGAAAAAGLTGIITLIDKTTVSFEEQAAVVDELEAEQAKLYGAGSEIEQLRANVDNLTESEKARLSVLEAQEQALQRQIEEARQLEYEKWRSTYGGSEFVGKYDEYGNYLGEQQVGNLREAYRFESKVSNWRKEFSDLEARFLRFGVSTDDYTKQLSELFSEVEDGGAEALREYADAGIKLTDSEKDLLDLSNRLVAAIADVSEATDGAAESTGSVADTLNKTAEAADAAESALKGYEEALKGLTDYEANANAMKSAYDKAVEDFQAGKLNTPDILSFLDMTVPADKQRELGYNIKSMMEYATQGAIGQILGSDNPAVATYDLIAEMFSAGNLEGIVQMENGVITAISSWEELGNAMGTTAAVAEASVSQLTAFSDTGFYTFEEATNILGNVNNALKETGKLGKDGSMNMADFAEAFKMASNSVNESDMANKLEAFGRAVGRNWEEILGVSSAEAAREKLAQIVDQTFNEVDAAKDEISSDPATIKVGVESENLAAEAAAADATVESALSDKEVTITPKVDESKAEISKVPDQTFEINADGSSAENTVSGVRGAVESIPRSKQITISAFDYASHIITGIKNALQALPNNKTITITTVQQSYTTQPGVGYAPNFASGTDYFVGGKALVNDGEPVRGSAAELIVDKGRAFIANDGEPAVVNLSPGAKVYTATETRDIFDGGISDVFPAFAGGTGLGRPPVSASTGVYSGSYSGGTGASGAGSTDRQSGDDTFRKEINDKLNNIDKQIELARNRNDTAKEQALIQEAARMVKDYVQQYLDKGFSNTSDEVLDLLNRGYGYSDDLMNELVDSLEALTNTTSKANRLEEKKQAVEDARAALENAREQRTVRIFNAATNQFEWVARAEDVLKAEEALIKAEKELQQEQIVQELEALKSGNIGDIGSLTISGALREVIAGASEEEQRRITDILNAISGGAKDTVDTSGYSVFRSSDSHDVYYQFGDLRLSEGEASKMTVKELADQLRALAIT